MAKLVFYYGSMNSSKTAQLIMNAFNFEQQGKKFHIIKSSQDTRDTKIKSRALNTEMDCTPISHFVEILQLVQTHEIDWLFVDEVQFMDEEMISTLALVVDHFNIDVICYGLVTDFQGKLFEGSKKLIEEGASLREIKNQCLYCESKATHNMRLLDSKPVFEGEVIQPGGNESYVSVCRRCFREAKNESEREKRVM
ncbi:thymidine kinase [Priestia megaterium]